VTSLYLFFGQRFSPGRVHLIAFFEDDILPFSEDHLISFVMDISTFG
jgi:hypothetical protein